MKSLIRVGFFLVLGLVFAVAIAHQGMAFQLVSQQIQNPATRTANRISQIEQTWKAQYENYFDTRLDQTPLTAGEITADLRRLGDDTNQKFALIYVFPDPEALELVLVIPGMPLVRRTIPEARQEELDRIINSYRSEVSRPIDTQRYLAPSQQLYRWIVRPLELYLQAYRINTLVFCVGAELRSLPLAALHDGRQFLIEKYSFGVIPAFSLTDARRDRVTNTQVLAMGASEFQNLEKLPAVPLELAAVQNSWQGEVFLNQEFTLENLQQELDSGQYAIVHLATHAEFKSGSPENSFIQFWQNEQLKLNQLRQFDWNQRPIELLVLSACQTALGDNQAELGFAGLSFQAGVKTSLASLWRVSDLGTLALMSEFYDQLARPEVATKAEALRRAQIALLKRQVFVESGRLHTSNSVVNLPQDLQQLGVPNLSNPYIWAAFTLVGSPW